MADDKKVIFSMFVRWIYPLNVSISVDTCF